MLDFIGDLIRGADAPREQDSERDGVLSYAGEWHALILGITISFAAAITGNPEWLVAIVPVIFGLKRASGKALREMAAEAWYSGFGIVAGWILGTLL